MFRKITNFIQYNNGFTLAVLFVMLGGGTALASNENVRQQVADSIVSSEETVVSVDNSYIVDIDLDQYTPIVQIILIEEDDEFYYVSYEIDTIEIVDGVWKGVVREDVMQVAKEQLGNDDLGLYVAEELDELIATKIAYLREVQEIEKKIGANQKVVERTYSGLVGRFLDPEQETFVGYDPVVAEEETEDGNENTVVVVADSTDADTGNTGNNDNADSGGDANTKEDGETADADTDGPSSDDVVATTTVVAATSSDPDGTAASTTIAEVDITPPVIELVGSAMTELAFGDAYTEEGATAIDDTDGDVASDIVIEGTVDSEVAGEYIITYSVSDAAGNTADVTRTVTVLEEVVPETDEEDVAEEETASSTPEV